MKYTPKTNNLSKLFLGEEIPINLNIQMNIIDQKINKNPIIFPLLKKEILHKLQIAT